MLSRVADSLYWLSRYLERAEHTARLVDVHLNLMLDHDTTSGTPHQKILLQALNQSVDPALENPVMDTYVLARDLTFDSENGSSILNCISTARENARQIREQISSEMYEQLNRLYLKVRSEEAREQFESAPYEFFAEVKDGAHLFEGVANETFAHGEAYLFMRVGKNIERASSTAQLLRAHAQSLSSKTQAGEDAFFEWVALLRSCTSFEAYCKEYTADLSSERILEFLLLDEEMPRSVRFCANQVEKSLEGIARFTGRKRDSPLLRNAGKLAATMNFASIDEILKGDLEKFLSDVRWQCGAVHGSLFATYIGYSVENAIAA